VVELLVTGVDEVTTYLLRKLRSVAKEGVTDAPKNNTIRIGTSFKALAVFIVFLRFFSYKSIRLLL